MAKRRRNDLLDDFAVPLTFAGLGVGTSVIGGVIDPIIPAGITNPVTSVGSTLGNFTGPVSVIAGGAIVFKQFKGIEEELNRKTRRK